MSRYPIAWLILRAGALSLLLLLAACPQGWKKTTVIVQGEGGSGKSADAEPAAATEARETPAWATDPDRAVVALVSDFRGFQEPCG